LNFHHQLLTDNSAAEEKQKHQKNKKINRGEREELGREEGKGKNKIIDLQKVSNCLHAGYDLLR
jgi:hypothetical protein